MLGSFVEVIQTKVRDLKPAFEPGASIVYPLLQGLAAQTLWHSQYSIDDMPSVNISSEELKRPAFYFFLTPLGVLYAFRHTFGNWFPARHPLRLRLCRWLFCVE